MQKNKQIILYVCEMIYTDRNMNFVLTQSDNPRHLQLNTTYPLWHKENMVNLGE